jgi:hypothetical protein
VPKKLLFIVTAVVGGVTALRRTRSRRAEQDLWAEATKPMDLR